jgi:peroxiredoxin
MDARSHLVLIRSLALSFALVGLGACAPTAAARAPAMSLEGTDQALHALSSPDAPTVVYFFSEHCPCVRAHDERIAALAREFGPRGVRFLAVDSEVGADVAQDRARAEARGYPFPLLVDPGARAASALGAEYATYTVVIDRKGAVVYRGGIDSDRTHLSGDATPYVRDALEDVLAGRPVRRPHADTLGCALRTF